MGQVASQGCPESPVAAARRPAHVLIVEATSPAGGVSVLPEGVSELLVEGVSEAAGDALPSQDEDDDHGVLAVVARPVPHQAEKLLLQRVPADHLQERRAGTVNCGSQAPTLLCTGCHMPLTSADQTWGCRSSGQYPGGVAPWRQQPQRLRDNYN